MFQCEYYYQYRRRHIYTAMIRVRKKYGRAAECGWSMCGCGNINRNNNNNNNNNIDVDIYDDDDDRSVARDDVEKPRTAAVQGKKYPAVDGRSSNNRRR